MKKSLLAILLLAFTSTLFAQQAAPAEDILGPALYRAKQEKKNVMVIFHASWCGWCKKMDASLSDPTIKKYIDDYYVITHITVQESDGKKNLENPGGEALLQSYRAGSHGLPFFAIVDGNNKLLADSYGKDGNLGCPATKEEVDDFIKILSKSSSINKEGLKSIEKVFRKNDTH